MDVQKIIYWISTALLSLIMLFSAQMYLLHYESAAYYYKYLGFPEWMIYPSAFAKVLALIAIWSKLSRFLKEWSYAGLTFDLIMAITAHYMAGDGITWMSSVGLLLVVVSYIMDGKLYGNAAFS